MLCVYSIESQAHNSATRTMVWTHKEQWLVTGDDEGKIRYFQSSLNKVREGIRRTI